MLDRNKLDTLLNEYGSLVWNKWNAPEDTTYIGRGSLFGNPIRLSNPKTKTNELNASISS